MIPRNFNEWYSDVKPRLEQVVHTQEDVARLAFEAGLSAQVAEDPDDSMLLEMWAGNALPVVMGLHRSMSRENHAKEAFRYAEAMLTEYKRRRTA